MKIEIPFLSLVAAVIYVFGLIMLSLHIVRSVAILTAQNNWAANAMDQLLEF